MIRHNWFYKLMALSVALALWFYVNSERNPRAPKTFTVPIETHGTIKGYAVDLTSNLATVTVQGLKSVVDGINREDVSAWVDLGNTKTSGNTVERRLHIKTDVAGVSHDDIDVSVAPVTVRAKLEAISGKRLPAEVKFVSAPPIGYSYANPLVIPRVVSISGKSKDVSEVKRLIITLPEQTTNRSIDDYFDVKPLDSKGEIVNNVTLNPDKVRLKLGISEVPATKIVIISPNVTGNPQYPNKVTRISVSPSQVTLEGRPSALDGVSTITTDNIPIDDTTTTITLDANLREPPGVKVVGRNKVRVTIHIVPQ